MAKLRTNWKPWYPDVTVLYKTSASDVLPVCLVLIVPAAETQTTFNLFITRSNCSHQKQNHQVTSNIISYFLNVSPQFYYFLCCNSLVFLYRSPVSPQTGSRFGQIQLWWGETPVFAVCTLVTTCIYWEDTVVIKVQFPSHLCFSLQNLTHTLHPLSSLQEEATAIRAMHQYLCKYLQ